MFKIAIVGIDSMNNSPEKVYRAVISEYKNIDNSKPGYYTWNFKCEMLPEYKILELLQKYGEDKFLNLGFNKTTGKVTGKVASLDRFKPSKSHRPLVIIGQIQTKEGKLLGYIVATYDGKIQRIQLKEMLAYGARCTNNGTIPVQNAAYVPADNNGKSAHYKAYSGMPFIECLHDIGVNKYTDTRKVQTSENKKTLSKLEEIYTKEQIRELKLGKKNGVKIAIYADPKLTAGQMRALREGLEQKVDVRPFAHPDYKEICMDYYVDCLIDKTNIKPFLSPKYNEAQLFQLSLACLEGVNISDMCDAKLSADEMCELRERRSKKFWSDIEKVENHF